MTKALAKAIHIAQIALTALVKSFRNENRKRVLTQKFISEIMNFKKYII